ncbi:MAG: riboflavin synthase [Microcoleus sp. SIO2G3]|nr:riboflavin synthase [Microcoleus sp. SIO2G3]
MFTGLIQAIGTLKPWSAEELHISCPDAAGENLLREAAIGDSISVDGVCLTVTQLLPTGFLAAVSPETRDRSTLGRGKTLVNLEASLRVGSKLGGHFVTGHVDGIGHLKSSVQAENAWNLTFTVTDGRVSRYIVPKGSISVNGVSLTVADCDAIGSWFSVAVIPLTYAETNLQHLQAGDPVNLEGDVLGKYVEKFLRLSNGSVAVAQLETVMSGYASPDSITPEFLIENGYL